MISIDYKTLHKIEFPFWNKFIIHITENEWGGSILVMEKRGVAFCRTYWFNDEDDSIYFDWLDVDKLVRKCGLGTIMLDMHLKIAEDLGIKKSILWVKKNTWVCDWYKRRGYEYLKDYEKEENAIWLQKILN